MKNSNVKKLFSKISALVLSAVLFCSVLLCGCGQKVSAADLNGKYSIDGYTAYEFDGKGKGNLCIGNTAKYAFSYKVEDEKVTFDFEDDKVKDAMYSVTVDGNTLTITQGATTFTMTKE